MTTQTAIFDGLPTGLTLTGKVFDTDAPDTEVTGNSLAIAEGTNAKSRYVVVNTRATALPAGDYDIRLFVGSVPIAVGRFTFAGTDGETAVETAVLAELDPASRAAILTQELIESYAADGAAPTVAQALMMLLQHHQQKSVSGTTVTIKKLDKSTTAATYTLDSATDPTSIARAT